MDCEEIITSEDYIDIIVNSSYIEVNEIDRGCYIYVNQRIVNLYVPLDYIPDINKGYFRYEVLPKCYTIMEETENVADSIFAEISNSQSLDGSGIMMGFIDTGIDYRNPAFRNSDGSSRIKYLWDQSISGNAPEGLYYGAEFDKNMIDNALRAEDPFSIVPSVDTNGHGTYIASIACGSDDSVTGLKGIAPNADIAVVKLKEAKNFIKELYLIPTEDGIRTPVYQENDILLALKYLDEVSKRENKTLVVCLALGSHIGSLGALPFLSSYITYFSEENNFVVVGTGNEANKRHHYSGRITAGSQGEIEIRTNGNRTGFWMEIWGVAPDIYSIGITSPGGDRIEKIIYKIAESQAFNFVFENTQVMVDYLLYGQREEAPFVIIRMVTPSDGVWKIQLNAERVINGEVNAFLPIQQFIQGETYFLESDPNRTLVNPSGTQTAISVGAYDIRNNAIYYASGRGYPIQEIIKPDIAAFGVRVLGASNRNDGSLVAYSGTGISAAVTAGAIALFMQWAVVRGNAPYVGSVIVKNFLLQSASRSDNRQYPNREWGFGALDLEEMFSLFRYS